MLIKNFGHGYVKKAATSLLEKKGFYKKDRIPPVDMRTLVSNPIDALKRSSGFPVLINISLTKCLNMNPLAFRCTKESGHPFIDTAISILDSNSIGYIGSPLYRYYEYFQPSNLTELLGLEKVDDCLANKLSPYAFVFPWDGTPNIKFERQRFKDIAKENMNLGYSLSGREGWPVIGPVSNEKGMMEFNRIGSTLQSIKINDYHRSPNPDGDVCGVVLCKKDDHVVMLSPGNHRVAALVALDYCDIPVRIGTKKVSIIWRDEVSLWPAVREGFFTIEQALKIFDRVFDGRQPFF